MSIEGVSINAWKLSLLVQKGWGIFCWKMGIFRTLFLPWAGPLLPTSYMCLRAMLLQLCPTLCDLMDCSLTASSAHGIPQARILEWVAVPSSRGSSWLRDRTGVSLTSPELSGRFFTTSATWEALLLTVFLVTCLNALLRHSHILITRIVGRGWLYTYKNVHVCFPKELSSQMKDVWEKLTKLVQVELILYLTMTGFLKMCETINGSLNSSGKAKRQSGI